MCPFFLYCHNKAIKIGNSSILTYLFPVIGHIFMTMTDAWHILWYETHSDIKISSCTWKKCIQSKFYRNTVHFKFMCIIVGFHFHRNQKREKRWHDLWMWFLRDLNEKKRKCWPTFEGTDCRCPQLLVFVRKISSDGKRMNDMHKVKQRGEKTKMHTEKCCDTCWQTKVKEIVICTRRNSKNQPTLSQPSLN